MSKVKHRHSKQRGRKRRTHYKAEEPQSGNCPQCGKQKRPHCICLHCGYYKGRQIISAETVEERKERKEQKRRPL